MSVDAGLAMEEERQYGTAKEGQYSTAREGNMGNTTIAAESWEGGSYSLKSSVHRVPFKAIRWGRPQHFAYQQRIADENILCSPNHRGY